MHGASSTQFSINLYLLYLTGTLFNGFLAELFAILDSFSLVPLVIT